MCWSDCTDAQAVCIWHKQVFSWCGSFNGGLSIWWPVFSKVQGPTLLLFSLYLTLKLMFSMLELVCGQKRYLQQLFNMLNMLAISVAIKMSMAPTRSYWKILRKVGMSENQIFTPKWKFVKKIWNFLCENKILRHKSCTNVFIWDKR